MGAKKPMDLHTGHRTKEELAVMAEENKLATGSRDCFNGSPPKELIDAYAKKEWKRIKEAIEPMAIFGDLDKYALVGYCNICSYAKRANDELSKQPLLIETEKGTIANPLINVVEKFEKLKIAYATKAGISVDSRLKAASLKLKQDAEAAEDDPYADI